MRLRTAIPVVGVLAACVIGAAPGAGPVLRDGDVLGPDTWEAARDLLPDEILDHYRRGEYVNRFIDLSVPGYRSLDNPPDFQAASRANRGRYSLDAAGSIVETQSGQAPAYITGLPFPDIDPSDAQAGTKVVWNSFYATWYRGDCHFLNELVMMGKAGVERRIRTDVHMRMLDGAPEARGRANPDNLSVQTMAHVVWPADLKGTVSLSWRFRDADKHDALWSYVPGLRRARRVSPLNRSDGFLGSDISMDDGAFFDGKPEDFTFRVLSRREQLMLVDPFSVRGEGELVPVAGGGWRTLWKDVPRIGADDPEWRGLPWAPVSAVLARRPAWIVEAVSKEANYLYGRLVLRFDADTYQGTWASKYDRAGTLFASYQVSRGAYYTPDGGKSYIPAGGIAVQTAENFVYKRATVVLFPTRNEQNPADYRVSIPDELFSADALVRLGQ